MIPWLSRSKSSHFVTPSITGNSVYNTYSYELRTTKAVTKYTQSLNSGSPFYSVSLVVTQISLIKNSASGRVQLSSLFISVLRNAKK
jgi:hypothetical protein